VTTPGRIGRHRKDADPRWLARRRWARAGLLYAVMLAIAVFMIGPFVYSAISSVKDDPTGYPPVLLPEQLRVRNWTAAWRLARAAGGSGLTGEWRPGGALELEVTWRAPDATGVPVASIPIAGLGTGRATVVEAELARSLTTVHEPVLVGSWARADGVLLTYRFRLEHRGADSAPELPFQVVTPRGWVLVEAAVAPNLNRGGVFGRGTLQWADLTSGALGYVFRSYTQAWTLNRLPDGSAAFPRWVANSFIVALTLVVTGVVFASMAGYALARLVFPGRGLIFGLVLFAQMVPGQVIFISNYLVLRDGIWGFTGLLGVPTLLGTLGGIIAPALVGAAQVFIMKQFMEAIPREIDEAARIDGAGPWTTFTRVIMPLCGPAVGALVILSFQGAWNGFFWPLVVVGGEQTQYTLPIGLNFFKTFYTAGVGRWDLILAGSLISAIPVLVLFIVFQRNFIEGVSFTAVKG
jgi:multiple sugar transport system permease protein